MVLYNECDHKYLTYVERSDIEAHRIVDKYNAIYVRIRNSITDANRRSASKEVIDIVKSNHKLNMTELNKHILEILRDDEAFKARLMN